VRKGRWEARWDTSDHDWLASNNISFWIWGTANFFSSPQTVDQVYATGYKHERLERLAMLIRIIRYNYRPYTSSIYFGAVHTVRYFVTLRGAVIISRRGAVFRDAVRVVRAMRYFMTRTVSAPARCARCVRCSFSWHRMLFIKDPFNVFSRTKEYVDEIQYLPSVKSKFCLGIFLSKWDAFKEVHKFSVVFSRLFFFRSQNKLRKNFKILLLITNSALKYSIHDNLRAKLRALFIRHYTDWELFAEAFLEGMSWLFVCNTVYDGFDDGSGCVLLCT